MWIKLETNHMIIGKIGITILTVQLFKRMRESYT